MWPESLDLRPAVWEVHEMSDDPTAHSRQAPRKVPRRVLRHVAANLTGARQRAGLTQEQLAERSEVDLLEIDLVERAVILPHIDTVVLLAGALDVLPGELCAGVVWDVEQRRFV
jgi:ribosome-binding protein aMBF1 (putative translation factor)